MPLTLIGMTEDTFFTLYFFHWILSAEFLAKLSKLFEGKPVVPGGAGGAMAPSILADQLTLSQPRGANFAHQITLVPRVFM